MIFAILQKEWRQHSGVLISLVLLVTVGLLLTQNLEPLEVNYGGCIPILGFYLSRIYLLCALVIGNFLIATEYRQRTQVFLSALPMPPWLMLSVKYGIGLFLNAAIVSILLAISVAMAWNQDDVSSWFFSLLWLRVLVWVGTLWSVVFCYSFLGRYRMAIGFVVVSTLIWLEQSMDAKISSFGPFELLGAQFGYEREAIPVLAIIYSCLIASVATGIGFSIGLAADASLSAMLSERMSAREKTTILAGCILFLTVIGTLEERVRKTEPLILPGAVDIEGLRVKLSVAAASSMLGDEDLARLREQAVAIASELDAVAEYLQIDRLPMVFLVHRRDFDEKQFEVGKLDSRQGFLLRYNAVHAEREMKSLLSQVIRGALNVHQHTRLDSDARGWILHGFAAWWPIRENSKSVKDFQKARGFQSTPHSAKLKPSDLSQWRRFQKEIEASIEDSSFEDSSVEGTIAGGCLVSIGMRSDQNLRTFLSQVLGYRAPHDFRAWIHDHWHSVPGVLKRTTSLDFTHVVQAWNEALEHSL